MSSPQTPLLVFWSWQSDSPPDVNRNFIEACLKKACKAVGKDNAILLAVDRDTRGVGGTPAIADTILTKIRSADVFVWDATLVALSPKPSPNPNVLFELGYAFAVLGEGRLIGVMNSFGVPPDAPLPFDLNHRRWPIRYSLPSAKPPVGSWGRAYAKIAGLIRGRAGASPIDRAAVQAELVRDLTTALKDAIAEPRLGALRSDVDLHAALALWRSLNSEQLSNWHESQLSYPQYETREALDRFANYLGLAARAENAFSEQKLADLHAAFVDAVDDYLSTSAVERVPHGDSSRYVISTKATERHLDDYDERYDRQLKKLGSAVDALWAAWTGYVHELRSRYPEVTSGVGL
jgi:hypothetical protein